MKCSACGAEVRNGRCTFCGYRPTEQDAASEHAWAEEKARLSGRVQDPVQRQPVRMPKPRVRRPASRRSDDPGRARSGRPPGGDPPAARKPSRHKARHDGSRQGFGVKLAVRLMVFGWALFCGYTFCLVLKNEAGIDLPGMVLDLLRAVFSSSGG